MTKATDHLSLRTCYSVILQYGVEKFDKNKLTPADTVEKNVLPTADDIAKEKEVN